MKKNIYIIPALLLVLLGSSCKKYLDVNKDPNNPADVHEPMLLFPIETSISTVLAGGSLTIGNYATVGITTAYWTQQLAINQTAPQIDGYRLRPADVDQIFLSVYSNELQNLQILNQKAETNGNHSYGVIAKVLTAYTLGTVTDVWGDVPYSQAFNGRRNVPYDKQEDVYKTLQSLLDSAILENGMDPGYTQPGTDDVIYSGAMNQWVKFAYTLKARFYMHLTKAPGYNAATQSNLALTALQNGFTSTADEAAFTLYSRNAGAESPWYENFDPAAGPNVLASTFVDSLVARNDPRLPIMVAQGSNNDYEGRIIGSDIAPDYSVYSIANNFYAAKSSPSYIFNYAEALFLKAEAIFHTSGAADAQPVYVNAINSHMAKLGLDTTSTAVQTYVASRALTKAGINPLQLIMEEKSIANFLAIENYNDWRRTGFPILSVVQSAYVPTIPRRLPYPLGELTANPQPQQSAAITDRVWWDAQ
jgi:hypothetical protein